MLDASGLQETDCDGLLGQSRVKPAEPTLAAMQGVSACSKALEALDSHATRQRNAAKNPNPLSRGEREQLTATKEPTPVAPGAEEPSSQSYRADTQALLRVARSSSWSCWW